MYHTKDEAEVAAVLDECTKLVMDIASPELGREVKLNSIGPEEEAAEIFWPVLFSCKAE